jgi:glutathione synthase/RimK-type ligase-like ATP-grasp enzyme
MQSIQNLIKSTYSSTPSDEKVDNQEEPFILLVIQQDNYDWQEIIKNALPQMKIGETLKVEDRYVEWLEAASNMFGEHAKLDILTIDVLVEANSGKEYVLEVNGTSSGLGDEDAEDNAILAKLLIENISKLA